MDTAAFPPIEQHGVIGNCRTAALVSSRGTIDWCCLPHFDSPAFFLSLLDPERGGEFTIRPVDPAFRARQHYLEGTNVLVTTFETPAGAARVIDAFTVTSEERKRDRFWPSDEIVRVVEGLRGELELEVIYRPRPNYGQSEARLTKRPRFGVAAESENDLLLLRTELPEESLVIQDLGLELGQGTRLHARFHARAGRRTSFSMTFSSVAPAVVPPLGEELLGRLDETVRYWRAWSARCRYAGPYEGAVRRSALALKLLTFAPSGAIIAALTTSLPESPGGVRNWDYRYCWLRDAALTTRALVSLGYYDEARAFLDWMLHSTALTRPRLQVLYTIYGESSVPERELPWLRGYRDSGPVRVGNAASHQFQLDVYGEVLSAVFQLAHHVDGFDGETRKFILGLGKAVTELWDKPDEGIWEVRSERRQHTQSKVMAWVALDRLCRTARHFGWRADCEGLRAVGHEIRARIEARGFNRALRSYVRAFDSPELDASLLVLSLFGYAHASSARMRGTCRAIVRGLSRNGLLYRYREVDDGLPDHEGSFGICNFWLAENFARAGDLVTARCWFERLLARDANRLGLWAEELDPDTGAFLGNYPQAFTHVGLINAAVTLRDCELGRGAMAA